MKTIILASALGAVTATHLSFTEYMLKFGRKYQSREELLIRRNIYAANVAKIEKHNSEGHTWHMSMNQFADLTAEEFGSRMVNGGFRAQEQRHKNVNLSLLQVKDVPTSVDWVTAGAVTPVKNQGQCGSCWSFSTTGSVEGINFITTGTLVSLSEQQLVECSGPQGDNGCNGGLMDNAFQYIIDNGGICAESAYPYTSGSGVVGACANTCTKVATITGFTNVPVNSEDALLAAVAVQPVSIAIEADQSAFQFYSGGVMTGTCGTALDHGVLVVGYGVDATTNTAFWKVKNSWGPTWGEEGYIRLGRGAAFAPSGQCGILMSASYPTTN